VRLCPLMHYRVVVPSHAAVVQVVAAPNYY
jgi:hypothetical protein